MYLLVLKFFLAWVLMVEPWSPRYISTYGVNNGQLDTDFPGHLILVYDGVSIFINELLKGMGNRNRITHPPTFTSVCLGTRAV